MLLAACRRPNRTTSPGRLMGIGCPPRREKIAPCSIARPAQRGLRIPAAERPQATAVIAAAGSGLGALGLALTIVVTIVVYWLAEQYAELLGEHASGGRLSSIAQVRSSLAGA
jgi:hypothetical protein